ncbi:SMC-Scp complex subunit ScpB [Tessaracoccus rhinocerotis]|uniref:SMC-Scp complex subunit ScpB n=1 Tax=Tessaracoccus rhinocerotis TaxID=1689449 RepID=A0A553JW17_9ACTN|nr:SMC-Scp complex subunit ScpB [Tessaracoccus rhinocerotis]TRY16633.1 SMC-Scp complex subunit ScpB [Tessaracoccus rhinocerotis]
MSLSRALEAMLLMATEPVAAADLAAALEVPEVEVTAELEAIARHYADTERGFELRRVAGGWRLATAEDLAEVIEAWVVSDQRSRLSQAALETLSVIAYLQPVTRGRIAGIRGVNVDGVVKTLLVRGLISEAGEDPHSGAMTFTTTSLFLQKLGLDSLDELPDLAPLLPDAVALEAELTMLVGEQPVSDHPQEDE